MHAVFGLAVMVMLGVPAASKAASLTSGTCNITHTVTDASVYTVTCSSENIGSEDHPVLRMELFAERGTYLAGASVDKTTRNPDFETALVVRSMFNSEAASFSIIVQETNLPFNLHYDHLVCHFHLGSDLKLHKGEPKVTHRSAHTHQWKFLPSPGSAPTSGQLDLEASNGVVFQFDSATQPINSLELFRPEDTNDSIPFIWKMRRGKKDGVIEALLLTVVVAQGSEIAAAAGTFEGKMEFNKLKKCSVPPALSPSMEICPVIAIALGIVVFLAIVVVMPLVLYYRRRAENKTGEEDVESLKI